MATKATRHQTSRQPPAYRRIQNTIRDRIESGKLMPGDAVPSERELARVHQVSLMTARHALEELEREGLVDRRHGVGTFVAPPRIHFNKLASFTEQMASRGLAVRSRILDLGIVGHEPDIVARLALPTGAKLVKIERLRLAASEPFALERCYLAAAEFSALAETALDRGSLFSVLQRDYGIELAYADEEVDATSADEHTAALLAVPSGAPLLRMRQVIYSVSGRATIYVLGYYRSDRHSLLIRRFR